MATTHATDETKKSVEAPDKAAEALSTPELLKEITHHLQSLEATMVAAIGFAAMAGITTVNLLLVTAILALTAVLPAWVAGLCVSGAVLSFAVGGYVLWRALRSRPSRAETSRRLWRRWSSARAA